SGTNSTIIQAVTGSKSLLGSPTAFSVTQVTNNYGVFNEFDNILNWTLSTDPNVIAYNIYRNNIFIAQVDSTTNQYIDTNSVQSGIGTTVIYSIASIDSTIQQGPH